MLLLSLLACGPRHGGTGVDDSCTEASTELALAEDSPLGFTAASVLAWADGEHPGIFTWGMGGETDATVTVAAAERARYVDSEPADPGSGASCTDRVEIDATVAFATDDGAFDESWDVALLSVDGESLGYSSIIENGAFAGTYDLEADVYDLDYDHLRARTEGSFDAAGGVGSLYGEAGGTYDCSDTGGTCSEWTETIDIGSWATDPA